MTAVGQPPLIPSNSFTLVNSLRCGLAHEKASFMLWTIAIILLVLWALGMVTATTMGGFIHILLVVAVIAVLIRVIQGRKVLGS